MTSTHFPLPLNGQWDDSETYYTLDEPFAYVDDEKDMRVDIPAGFVTDFNSVPWVVRWYFNPKDYMKAGLVHDWLYKHPASFTPLSRNGRWANTPVLNRDQCDDIHRRILDLMGMRWSKRQAVWAALKIGAGIPWANHRSRDPQPVVVAPDGDHKSDTKNDLPSGERNL